MGEINSYCIFPSLYLLKMSCGKSRRSDFRDFKKFTEGEVPQEPRYLWGSFGALTFLLVVTTFELAGP